MQTIEKLLRTYEKAVRDHARGSADRMETARLFDSWMDARRALRKELGLSSQPPAYAYRVKGGAQ